MSEPSDARIATLGGALRHGELVDRRQFGEIIADKPGEADHPPDAKREAPDDEPSRERAPLPAFLAGPRFASPLALPRWLTRRALSHGLHRLGLCGGLGKPIFGPQAEILALATGIAPESKEGSRRVRASEFRPPLPDEFCISCDHCPPSPHSLSTVIVAD